MFTALSSAEWLIFQHLFTQKYLTFMREIGLMHFIKQTFPVLIKSSKEYQ